MPKRITLQKLEALTLQNTNNYIILHGGSIVHNGIIYKDSNELVSSQFTTQTTLSAIEKLTPLEV